MTVLETKPPMVQMDHRDLGLVRVIDRAKLHSLSISPYGGFSMAFEVEEAHYEYHPDFLKG